MRKTAWLFTLIVVTCFSVLYFNTFVSSRQQELEAGLHNVNRFSYLVAENIGRSFDAVDLLTNELRGQFSQSANWTQWDEAKGHQVLAERKTRALPQLRDFAVYDRDGVQHFHSTLMPAPRIKIDDRPYFKALKQGADRALYGPFKGRNSGKFTYTLSRRIHGPAGQFTGVMFAAIEPTHFQTLCHDSMPSEQFELYLTNREGQIISGCRSSADGNEASGHIMYGESIDRALAGGRFAGKWQNVSSLSEEGYHLVKLPVRNYPELQVVTAVADSALLTHWRERQLHVGALYLVGVLVTLAAFGLIRRQMLRLQDMTQQLRESRDDLALKVREATRSLQEKTEAAEAASVAKGVFLANMSHEIRTPLNAVLGMSYLALKTDLSEQQRGYISKIVLSGEHLLGLMNNLLDMSKIEAGKIELDPIDFSLKATLSRVQQLLEDKARAKGLSIVLKLDPQLPDAMHGDPLRLTQILVNFADNAIKFSSAGQIDIRSHLERRTANGWLVRFEVHDKGVGMSEAQLARLFQPFTQADSSTTRKFGGTGLGLAISKQLAMLMGGDVGAASAVGQGSTFWFTVQLSPARQPLKVTEEQSLLMQDQLPSVAGLRVLLAEDNLLNQQVAQEMLADLGVDVGVAATGREVLAALQQGDYDCVLMDCQMPDMDGFETTRQIRADQALKHVHVIAMTANASASDRAQCLAAGMNDYLAKPVDPVKLHTMLALWHPDRLADAGPASNWEVPAQQGGTLPAGEAQEDVLDIQGMSQLVHGDPARLRHLLDTYMASTRDHMAGLQQAMNQADVRQQAFWAHKIKGSAPWIGARGLAWQCQELEKHAAQADPEGKVPALAADVMQRCEQIMAFLARQIHANGLSS